MSNNLYRPTPYSISICILIQINTSYPKPCTRQVLCDILVNKNTYSIIPHNWNAFLATYGRSSSDSSSNNILTNDTCTKLYNVLKSLVQDDNNPDDLVDFFVELEGLVENSVVDRSSLHGLYLRKNILGFDSLSFEAMARLWRLLRKFLMGNSDDNLSTTTTSTSINEYYNNLGWPSMSDSDVHLWRVMP